MRFGHALKGYSQSLFHCLRQPAFLPYLVPAVSNRTGQTPQCSKGQHPYPQAEAEQVEEIGLSLEEPL